MGSGRYIAPRAIKRGACGSASDTVPSAGRNPCPVEHQPGHSVSAAGYTRKEPASRSCDRLLSETVRADSATTDFRCRGEFGAFLCERCDKAPRSTPATRACVLGTAIAAIDGDRGSAPRELGHALLNAACLVLRSVQRGRAGRHVIRSGRARGAAWQLYGETHS